MTERSTTERRTLPIAGQSRRTMAAHALMKAQTDGLLIYRQPVDMKQDSDREGLRRELVEGGITDPELPGDDGQYFLAYVTDKHGRQRPVVIPVDHVLPFVSALAVLAGVIDEFEYRYGMFPE